MFTNAHGTSFKDSHIAGRDVNISNHSNHIIAGKPVLRILYENAAPGGFYISKERYDPPKCHEDTRLAIRQDLLDHVIAAAVSCIFWLYGAAGAGKSAIAQSFAETCQEKGLLIATFFFFRSSPLRNNADRLAASLAYQLAQSIPSTLRFIGHCIETHPAIFDSSLEDQLENLFIQPLHRACEGDSTIRDGGPRLVILDGLDECDTVDHQPSIVILRAVEKILKTTPIPIVLLVASRPEVHISSTFRSLDRRASIQTIRFGLNDHVDVDGDIRLYLNDKFGEIKRDHHFNECLPENWPDPEDVKSIVEKSSGQFIYAATIIRYIGHHRCKPHERLQAALDSQRRYASTVRHSPFKELDALYVRIFSGVEDRITTLSILFLALGMGGIANQLPRTIAYCLRLGPGDVELHLSSLTSLLKYEGEETPIRFFHTSLLDFLMDEQRSFILHIRQPAVHTTLAYSYIRHFVDHEPSAFSPASYSLFRAERDQELCSLVAKFEHAIPALIQTFLCRRSSNQLKSNSHLSTFNLKNICFSDLINAVQESNDIFGTLTNNSAYWDRYLEAIRMVFFKKLQLYLTDETTHDFLVLAAFFDDTHCFGLPTLPFASSLGMSDSAWELCYKHRVLIYGKIKCPFVDDAKDMLGSFLLDPQLAGKLFVTPEHFTRLTLKCLSVVIDTHLSEDEVIEPDENDFFDLDKLPKEAQCCIQAVGGLVGLLRKTPESRELISALRQNDQQNWLNNNPWVVEKCQEAIDSYLERHSLRSPGAVPMKQKQCSEEPVNTAEDPSISRHHGQKRAKYVDSSNEPSVLADATM